MTFDANLQMLLVMLNGFSEKIRVENMMITDGKCGVLADKSVDLSEGRISYIIKNSLVQA